MRDLHLPKGVSGQVVVFLEGVREKDPGVVYQRAWTLKLWPHAKHSLPKVALETPRIGY